MVSVGELPDAPFPTPPGVVYRGGDVARGHICPRCHVFLVAESRVVRLYRPEEPDTLDGRRSRSTGGWYYADGRRIRMHPRWFVHERCYLKNKPSLWWENSLRDDLAAFMESLRTPESDE